MIVNCSGPAGNYSHKCTGKLYAVIMILNFNDFCDNVIKTDEFDYINEKLTVSMDVNDTTDELVEFIEGYNREKIVVESGEDYSITRFKQNPVVDVFGCKCELDLTMCELSSTVSDDNTSFDARVEHEQNIVDGVVKVNFTLSMAVVMKGGVMIQKSRTVLLHELRHAYERATVYNNCPEMDLKERQDIFKKWSDIYNECTGHMKLYRGPSEIMRWLDGEEFYEILGAMYHCDTSEVSAFTQEAYEQCKECKSKQETELKMKDTDLYKTMAVFENVMHLLESDDVKNAYIENTKRYGFDDFPSIHQLVELIVKRYLKIRTNYGKVIALICGRFEKNEGLDLMDVRY